MEKEEVISKRRYAELEEIRSRAGGVLRPEDVVQFAKRRETALHDAFCWNDTEAAAQYRLWQARQIIRVCITVHQDLPGAAIRTYVSLYEDRGENGYRLLTDVMSDEEMRDKLLAQALSELRTWQQKYKQLEKLVPVFKAAEKVERKWAVTPANRPGKLKISCLENRASIQYPSGR